MRTIYFFPLLLIEAIVSSWASPLHAQAVCDAAMTSNSMDMQRLPWLAFANYQHVAAGGAAVGRWDRLFDASRTRPDANLNFTQLPPSKSLLSGTSSLSPEQQRSEHLRAYSPQNLKSREKRSWSGLVVPTPRLSPAYRRTFHLLLDHPQVTDRYDDIILKYADRFGLDPRLLKAIISAESEFVKDALSPHGAVGLMQVMPITAEEMGISRSQLSDPEANILAGAAYLSELFRMAWRRFKLMGLSYRQAPAWVIQRVIAAYNAGPRFLFRGNWYRETRSYVSKVLLFRQSKVTEIRGRRRFPFIPPFFMVPPSGALH